MYKKIFFLFCISFIVLNFSLILAKAADGGVDTSFSPGNLFGSDVFVILTQPNGKIMVAGDFEGASGNSRTGIARLNADGTLDSTFAGTGASQVRAAAIQPDGKVLIGGYFTMEFPVLGLRD